MMIVSLGLLVFPFAMIYAALSDLVSMTIANRVSAVLALSFPLLAWLTGMPAGEIGMHLVAGVACLSFGFAAFAAGWIGGGDAKLFAATAVWFGLTPALFSYVMLASVFGAVLTILLLLSRSQIAPATGIGFVDRLLSAETGVPYGIALGGAGLFVFSQSAWVDKIAAGLLGASM
ncbi:prepilin peptidase [Aurantimonas sp. VKM B-3413]|uniref:A24 family peptidase n=1 Tax=Aurantimonas sp. VKM B-3413 TaxID=2779401 RepID=UPI001E5C57AE|nr:prepilin peptidase [Aurantimonas sp. VKM B-3413]MCB8836819.1 prepilin peptidase [Aurantimonas sp. VKM B-3413]